MDTLVRYSSKMRRLQPTLLCVLLCAPFSASTFAARKAASSAPPTYKDVAPFSSSAFPARNNVGCGTCASDADCHSWHCDKSACAACKTTCRCIQTACSPLKTCVAPVYKDVALQISQDAFDSAGKVYFNAGVLSYASKLSVKGHYVNTSIFELLLPKAYALCPNW